jgi:8-oxo-dGTP pyrophosphatase MutT (NUDIX family)
MKTKQEFSSGGVVYKKNESEEPQFLLGKHSGYHKWVLPKGMIEDGETKEETAVRETLEELSVNAKIVLPEPIHIEKYSYRAELKSNQETPQKNKPVRRVLKYQEEGGDGILVNKTVTFFLMEYVSGNPANHGWEMEDAGWFSHDDALAQMSFEGEKKALNIAFDILTSK